MPQIHGKANRKPIDLIKTNKQWSSNTGAVLPCNLSLLSACVRCFGEDTCLSIPDIKSVVMVLPPSEPRITITGSNRLVRPASDLRGPLGVAPFKELHITSTVMKGDSFGGCEWRGCLCRYDNLMSYQPRSNVSVNRKCVVEIPVYFISFLQTFLPLCTLDIYHFFASTHD